MIRFLKTHRVSVGLIGLLVAIGYVVVSQEVLEREKLIILLEENSESAGLLYILLYMIVTLAFIPATPFSLIAGGVFGSFIGGIYVLIGATLGSLGAFLISRYLARAWAEKRILTTFPKLSEYDKSLELHGFVTVMFFRLIPLFPFNGLNFMLGLTSVKLVDYLWGTLLGMIPGVFVLTYLGGSLASGDVRSIAIALSLYVVSASAGLLYNKFKSKNV